jgi:hypothetical protein
MSNQRVSCLALYLRVPNFHISVETFITYLSSVFIVYLLFGP